MSGITVAPDVPLDKVEWRVDGNIDSGGGCRVVCYIDAPTVAGLLDAWVGPDRWWDRYEPAPNGALWCHLTVAFDDREVTKVDLGTPSNMEADKGLVSDAFKRVAMRKWRVGANVFDLPTLRITKFRQVTGRNGKTQAYLTGESHQEIAQQLRRLGFDDAAKHAEQAVVQDAPDDLGGDVTYASTDELATVVSMATARGHDKAWVWSWLGERSAAAGYRPQTSWSDVDVRAVEDLAAHLQEQEVTA